MKLVISLVTYNGQAYIPYLLRSLALQTFKDWELIVLDNNSSDGTVAAIKEAGLRHTLLSQRHNLGFAVGHNRCISWSESDYVMGLNQDIILEPQYLKRLITFLEGHPD